MEAFKKTPNRDKCLMWRVLFVLLGVLGLSHRTAGQAHADFASTLEQLPSTITSPDTVLFKCRFDRTASQFNSVVWSRGDNAEEVFVRTNHASAPGSGYEGIVVADQSLVTLSQDNSGDWSEATLTMQVDCTLADTYQCLITDMETQQSDQRKTLMFNAPSCPISVQGEMIVDGSITFEPFNGTFNVFLEGDYHNVLADTVSSPWFHVDGGNAEISSNGSTETQNPDAANCNYRGVTTGGTIRINAAGEYTVYYTVDFGGTPCENSVTLKVPDLSSADALTGNAPLSSGALAGIIIVVIVFFIGVLFIALLLHRRSKGSETSSEPQKNNVSQGSGSSNKPMLEQQTKFRPQEPPPPVPTGPSAV